MPGVAEHAHVYDDHAGAVRYAEHLGSGTSMPGERARACLDAALRRLGVEVRQAWSGAGPDLRAERRGRLKQHAGRDRTAPPGALHAISAWSPPR
ncbi:hypothetical protein [Nonomuraea sp. B19D2]|uniref:hypothetical protein n=1 Tax=Nonomuraea sp. B19D2 TaxID=3159561 RepID=UPI0032DAFEA8